MIITSSVQFLQEVKKYPEIFSVKSTTYNGKPCFKVTCEQNQTIVAIMKGNLEQVYKIASAIPTENYGSFVNVYDFMDKFFNLSLNEVNPIPDQVLKEELPERMRLQYKDGTLFKKALNLYLQDLSEEEQNKFISKNDLRWYKCFVLNKWAPISTYNMFMHLYIDGVLRTVSSEGLSKLKATHIKDAVPFRDGTPQYWNKKVTTFYNLPNIGKVALQTIISSPYLQVCEDCNNVYYYSDGLCSVCYPESLAAEIYKDYSYKAEMDFKFKANKEDGKYPLFLGIELELENRNKKNLIHTWKMLKDHVIIKRDGSVSEGMEICSAPATLSVHKEAFKEFFTKVKSLELKAESNCGMHVHVDKKHLTELQIGKILSFMYNKDNKKFINEIAGRQDNNYCSLNHEKKLTTGLSFNTSASNSYSKQLVRRSDEGRYTGLNLSPRSTIEFRIFAATTDYKVFMKNLEFVQSMIDFTKPGAINVTSLKDFERLDVYKAFVKANRKQYPELFAFINK